MTNVKPVTFVYPYYENPDFFRRQLKTWLEYPAKLQEKLSIIVVDDGSPKHPLALQLELLRSTARTFTFRSFRIDVDVRWNWLAARNIGAHYAQPGWIMMTDMDHVVTPDVLRDLQSGWHDENCIYRFSRVGTKTTPHPNSWFMTRDMFWKIGGYDEAASGFYGTDGEYRRRCAETAPVQVMTSALEHHEYEGDSSTSVYKRKQPEDARGKAILRARRGQKPKTLSFPYHEILFSEGGWIVPTPVHNQDPAIVGGCAP